MSSFHNVASRFGKPATHLFALLCAMLLVFGLKVQNYDLQPLVGPIDNRIFTFYTPYYPGLANLDQHELFDPSYRDKRKIVILGASAADSIGCDASWSKQDHNMDPPVNAHHSCSISSQLNDLLREQGFSDWRSFDLARNGTSLTPMLYTYSRAMEVKPDVIVWGESFPYFMDSNADADRLPSRMYEHLDAVFDRPSTSKLWQSYRETLSRGATGGWTLPPYHPDLLPPDYQAKPRARTTLLDLVSLAFMKARDKLDWDMPPRPTVLYPKYRIFQAQSPDTSPFVDPDPQLSYFQGFGLIGTLQKENGGKMVMYFFPQYDRRNQVNYVRKVSNGPFTRFLDQYGIGHKSLIDLPLKPVQQTYDGNHQTPAGNRVIAAAILKDLVDRHIVTRN